MPKRLIYVEDDEGGNLRLRVEGMWNLREIRKIARLIQRDVRLRRGQASAEARKRETEERNELLEERKSLKDNMRRLIEPQSLGEALSGDAENG